MYFNNELGKTRERIATIKDIEEVDVPDPCDEEAIGASFVDAVEHDKKLEANVEWSVPILPSTAIAEEKLYSLARFSADPEIGAKRMRNSVVTNIRVSQKGTGGNSYAVSMLEKRTMTKAMRGHISGQDFRMDLKNNVEDQFAFVIDGSSAEYSSVGCFDMAKIDVSEMHDATVVLRD